MATRATGNNIKTHDAAVLYADLAEKLAALFASPFASNEEGWFSNPIPSIHKAYPGFRLAVLFIAHQHQ